MAADAVEQQATPPQSTASLQSSGPPSSVRTAALVATVLSPLILLATLVATGAVAAFSPVVVLGPLVPAAIAAALGGAVVARDGRPTARLARMSQALGALSIVSAFAAAGGALALNGMGVGGARGISVTSLPAFWGLIIGLPTAAIVASVRRRMGMRLESLVQSWLLLGFSASITGGIWWRLGRGREHFANLPVWESRWTFHSFPKLAELTAVQDTATLGLAVVGLVLFLAAVPALRASRKVDQQALDDDLSAW